MQSASATVLDEVGDTQNNFVITVISASATDEVIGGGHLKQRIMLVSNTLQDWTLKHQMSPINQNMLLTVPAEHPLKEG
jgi:hypothetical protein